MLCNFGNNFFTTYAFCPKKNYQMVTKHFSLTCRKEIEHFAKWLQKNHLSVGKIIKHFAKQVFVCLKMPKTAPLNTVFFLAKWCFIFNRPGVAGAVL